MHALVIVFCMSGIEVNEIRNKILEKLLILRKIKINMLDLRRFENETDEEYLESIGGEYKYALDLHNNLCRSTYDKITRRIMLRIYVARNITLDEHVIIDCLNDITMAVKAMNGSKYPINDLEEIVMTYKILTRIYEKYSREQNE